jgi:purine-binding chemotaxis protein CheW
MRDLRSDTSNSEDYVTLGCFEVDGRVVAIDIANIREVVRWQSATPLPKAPALIEGVTDLRGAVVPIVDLGRALNGKPVQVTSHSRIIVTEVDGLVVGFGVDVAIEVLQVDVTSMEDPPALATQSGYDAVRAIVRRPDSDPIVVLSVEHLLESVYRSALPAQEGAA